MKKHLIVLTALLAMSSFAMSIALAGVGVSVKIGQPGFYGQIDVGDYYPRPEVVYVQPRIIHVVPVYAQQEPIYLRVAPGHAKRWSRYCREYNACGRPVYFVQDNWYKNIYAPRYHDYHEHGDDGKRYDRDYWDKHGGKHGGQDKHHKNGHDKGRKDQGHDRH